MGLLWLDCHKFPAIKTPEEKSEGKCVASMGKDPVAYWTDVHQRRKKRLRKQQKDKAKNSTTTDERVWTRGDYGENQ